MKVTGWAGLIFGALLVLFGGGCIVIMQDLGVASGVEGLIMLVLGFGPLLLGVLLIMRSVRKG